MNISYLDASADTPEELVMWVGVEVGMKASRREVGSINNVKVH